jgi:hypothetical protein
MDTRRLPWFTGAQRIRGLSSCSSAIPSSRALCGILALKWMTP